MKVRLVVALVLVSASQTAPAQPASYTAYRDVEYARPKGLSQRLDVFVPDGPGPWPLLVWVHGGGWQNGDKALQATGSQLRQATRGYVVASINYRLSGVAPHPAQIHDCKAAIRWLRLHAAEYRIDPARVGAWGSSAGGHLVALLGTSGDVPALEGDENPGASSRVSSVVDWYGPSDLPNMQAQGLPCSGDHASAASPEGKRSAPRRRGRRARSPGSRRTTRRSTSSTERPTAPSLRSRARRSTTPSWPPASSRR